MRKMQSDRVDECERRMLQEVDEFERRVLQIEVNIKIDLQIKS